jgi:putative restriction endonuclease
VTFVTDRTRQLSDRAFRDAAFSRMVRLAYDGRCAVSGLSLRNGGGRPEVAAAHIVPVADGGPDVVANGLALSGTLHWMFDRGLIAVAEDHSVLVSHNKVPADVVRRLIDPEQRLILPQNPRYRPHPDFLRWHRENVFGRGEPLPL